MDANYFTVELMEKKWDRESREEELVESVLEVKRLSDRLMVVKLEIKGSILNIVSAYAPQVGNSLEEKNYFRLDLDGLIESVSKQ